MTIAFRSVATAAYMSAVRTTTLTINKPAGTLDNDTLVAAITTTGVGITAPTGWQLVSIVREGNVFFRTMYVYVKTASGEPGSWTWHLAVPYGTTVAQGFVASYSGGAGTVVVLGTFGAKLLSSSTKTAQSPGGFSSQSNSQVLRIGSWQGAGAAASTVATVPDYVRRVMLYDSTGGSISASTLLTLQDIFEAAPAAIDTTSFVLNGLVTEALGITLALPSGDTVPTAQNVAPYDQFHYNLAATPTFAWTFADDDIGDYQTAYALRRKVGAGAYSWWNATAGGWQGTEVYNTSPYSWVTFPAAMWTSGTTYLWSVAVKDSHGTPSAYSTDTTVVADNAPPTVTVTQPELGYSGGLNPIVAWAFSGGTQGTTRIRIFDSATQADPSFNPDISTSIWDSGFSDSTLTNSSATAGVPVDLVSGQSYWAYVLAMDTSNRTPDWQSKLFFALPEVPVTPVVTATEVSSGSTGPRVDLTATVTTNLLTVDQSTMENSIVGWKALTNCTLARSVAQATDGEASLLATAASAATFDACTNEGMAGIPVVVGISYKALASIRGSGFAANRNCRLGIRWYDITGTLLSTNFSGTSSVANGAWVALSETAAAPANAVWAAIVVEVQGPANAEAAFIDSCFLGRSGAAVTWSVGGRVYGNLMKYDDATFAGVYDTLTRWVNANGNMTVRRDQSVSRSAPNSLQGIAQYGQSSTVPPRADGTISSPDIDVVSGQLYTASLWTYLSNARSVLVSIDWFDFLGDLISSSNGTVTAIGATTWTQVWCSATAPVLAATASIRVTLVGSVLADTINIDDVTFTQGFTLMTDLGGCIPMFVEVQYSDDAGATWADVRGAHNAFLDLNDLTNNISDFEATIGTVRSYRLRMVSIDGTVASAWSTIVTATQVGSGDWWLKDLYNSSLNAKMFVEAVSGGGFDLDGEVTSAKMDVTGRPDFVEIVDTWKTDVITFKSQMFGSDYLAFETLRKNNRPLFLQSDGAKQWYGIIDKRVAHLINSDSDFWGVDIEFIQVARPPV